jgi:amino acid transporter
MKKLSNWNNWSFLGFFTCLVTAVFTFGGIKTVAVAAGETENPRSATSLYSLHKNILTKPRKNIPKAVRRVFWHILIFCVFGKLAIGVMVPYTDANLLSAQKTGAPRAAQSPWVI